MKMMIHEKQEIDFLQNYISQNQIIDSRTAG